MAGPAPRLTALDRAIAWFDPSAAVRRAHARQVLAYYEAAKPTRMRNPVRDNSSPNALVSQGAASIRMQARFLERNHDLSRGALRVLVNNTVGPGGIGIEPQPRRRDGTIHTEYAAALRKAHKKWQRRPEVTRRLHWGLAQRSVAYTWFRDGECFAQELVGPVPFLDHGNVVPYSLELFEPDFVPLEYHDGGNRIRQGIQCNAWGRPANYYVFRKDPREGGAWITTADLKAIPASLILHVATLDRLHQLRGVSEFASVLTRIEDLKDYEESERIAAKVAAALTGYIKRSAGSEGMDPSTLPKDAEGNVVPRKIQMAPGMIIDNLLVGEEVGLIDSKRPNPNLIGWRSGQLRAFAAGFGTSYSSTSRDYGGTYSAQRQELVEQWVHYAVLTDEFVGMFVQPAWERFVQVAALSGAIPVPPDVEPGTEDDCLYIGQSMPWIDPMKETMAFEKQTQAGFISEPEVIRRAGRNPSDVMEQMKDWRAKATAAGLVLSSDAATQGAAASNSEVNVGDDESGSGPKRGDPGADPAQARE